MIQIQYEGFDNIIQTAVRNVNMVFQSSDIYEAIRKHEKFDQSNVPAGWIADLLETTDLNIQIDFYYSIHPFSKTIACDNPKNPGIIYLNRWNTGKPVDVLCNAMVHQCVHAANAVFPQYSFGHEVNCAEGQENTAPFRIAELAQNIINKGHTMNKTSSYEEVCEYSSTSSLLLQVKLQNSTLFQTYQ
jgi:hypothetical protein